MAVARRISSGEAPTITGDGSQSFDFVHVADVAAANVAAMASDVSGDEFNVGSGTEATVREIVERLIDIVGVRRRARRTEPTPQVPMTGASAAARRRCTSSAGRPELDLDEGLADVVAKSPMRGPRHRRDRLRRRTLRPGARRRRPRRLRCSYGDPGSSRRRGSRPRSRPTSSGSTPARCRRSTPSSISRRRTCRFPTGAHALRRQHRQHTRAARACAAPGARSFLYASSGSRLRARRAAVHRGRRRGLARLLRRHEDRSGALVAAYGRFFATVVFRLFVPYGPGQTGRMIPGLVEPRPRRPAGDAEPRRATRG